MPSLGAVPAKVSQAKPAKGVVLPKVVGRVEVVGRDWGRPSLLEIARR